MTAVCARPLVVTVVARPRARCAWIRLVGDVDMGGEPALADAVNQLFRSEPDVVVVDLTSVTFVCSTLANFVADVHAAVPDASLFLHGPSRMTRVVLAVSGLDTLVAMSDIESTCVGESGGADRGRASIPVHISHTTLDGVVRVAVNGDIDMLTADDLRQTLHELIGDSTTALVLVDLSGVGFCDSSGINALLAAYRAADTVGICLAIVDLSAQVRQVMQITGLLELLTADGGNVSRGPSDEAAVAR